MSETQAPPGDKSEAYLDIVWRQFKKNRFALASLWLLAPLFLAAIFAPAIASDQPFVFRTPDETLYPWFRALFNPAEVVDFAFNMALIGFFPWVAISAILNARWKRRGAAGRTRVLRVAATYAAIVAVLIGFFSFPSFEAGGAFWSPAFRPTNKYGSETFPERQFQAPEQIRAWYPPIPLGPTEMSRGAVYQPPGYQKPADQWNKSNDGVVHVLGTDNSGRDVLVRMIYGTRISLTVGFVAVGIYLTIGIVLGSVAGYFGGTVDILICRVIEVMMLFPSFFLILTLVAMLGSSIYIVMLVIGLTSWAGIARLTRGEVLKQRSIDYVAAARALGASHGRIIFRHILPNAISPALVSAPFGVAGAIITEAGLSLLGVGVRIPAPSWGTLLHLGNGNYHYWWLVVVPSLAMFFTVTVFNLIGSGLRDAMDPRLRV
jgi:peptide/nickel transport system permease protein